MQLGFFFLIIMNDTNNDINRAQYSSQSKITDNGRQECPSQKECAWKVSRSGGWKITSTERVQRRLDFYRTEKFFMNKLYWYYRQYCLTSTYCQMIKPKIQFDGLPLDLNKCCEIKLYFDTVVTEMSMII